MQDFGKILIGSGIMMVLLGWAMVVNFKLPGDILVQKGNLTVYIPLVTSLLLSLLLTLILNLFLRK